MYFRKPRHPTQWPTIPDVTGAIAISLRKRETLSGTIRAPIRVLKWQLGCRLLSYRVMVSRSCAELRDAMIAPAGTPHAQPYGRKLYQDDLSAIG